MSSGCQAIVPDGGDCEVIGPRRPTWDCPERMRAAIPSFVKVYSQRPFKKNPNGMRFEHSFALWYMLRSLNPVPRFVIESGANKGHSTWIIRRALPDAKIFSLDPSVPEKKQSGVVYFNGKEFCDFNVIDWSSKGVDVNSTVILFDDHQNSHRRIMKEGRSRGFKKFMVDDNYDFLHGDAYSMKWACEKTRKSAWRGSIKDDFGRVKKNLTWREHEEFGKEMQEKIRAYYEFPPIATTRISGMNLKGYTSDEGHRATALLSDKRRFDAVDFAGLDMHEFRVFTHPTYIELF